MWLGAVCNEQLRALQLPRLAREKEWRRPIPLLGIDLGACIEEKPHAAGTSTPACDVQQRSLLVVGGDQQLPPLAVPVLLDGGDLFV